MADPISSDAGDPRVSAGTRALKELAAGWRFFHDLFRESSRAQFEWLTAEPARSAWRSLAEALEPDLPRELPLPEAFEQFEQDSLACFEVGLPNPPCPLLESHWIGAKSGPAIQHEHVLFFLRFGLRLRSAGNDPPDHLRHQLEFLAWLCELEAAARSCGPSDRDEDRIEQLRLARAQYLERHPGRWIPLARTALETLHPDSWMTACLGLLAGWCRAAGALST